MFDVSWKRLRRSSILMLALIVTVLGTITVAAFLSFTQTAPSVTIPAPAPPPALTPSCSTLANFTTPTAGTGSIAYSCTGQSQAFTVSNAPTTGVSATAIIHGLPSTVTLTFYSGIQNLNPCPGSAPSATILNNTSMNIANGSYNYCVFYNGLTSGLVFNWNVNWH